MSLVCKRCGSPIEFDRARPTEQVACAGCGKTYQLISKETDSTVTQKGGRVGSSPDTAALKSGQGRVMKMPQAPPGYRLLRRIGRGGMGTVYLATQAQAGRTVALKIVRPDLISHLSAAARSEAISRFTTEARAAAQLEHDHIVRVYEVGVFDGQPFYAMQYVDGKSLAELVADGPLSDRDAANYTRQAARGVHEAHSHGVLHRDLKPHNILLEEPRHRALVADFGLAKLMDVEEGMTVPGAVLGSPPYMSPEQAQDSSNVGVETDVYGLGATLYYLTTGRPPFQASNTGETLRQVIHEEPAPPRQLNASISRDLETICLKCLDKNPRRRYESAKDLAEDLWRFLEGRPNHARPVGRAERVWRWCRRQPLAASLIVAVVATLIGGIITTSAMAVVAARNAKREKERREQLADAATVMAQDFPTAISRLYGSTESRLFAVNMGLTFLEKLGGDASDDAQILHARAMAYIRLGELQGGINSANVGDTTGAIESFHKAEEIADRLHAIDPANVDYRGLRIFAGIQIARIEQYLSAKPRRALARLEEWFQELDRLCRQNPQESLKSQRCDCLIDLALAYSYLGEHDKAIERARLLVEYARDVKEETLTIATAESSVRALGTLAYILAQSGDSEGSLKASDEGIQILLAKRGDGRPTPPVYDEHVLGGLYQAKASALYKMGKSDEAISALVQAGDIAERLLNIEPSNTQFAKELLFCHTLFAEIVGMRNGEGDLALAEENLARAVHIGEELVKATPHSIQQRLVLAEALWNLAQTQGTRGGTEAAADATARAKAQLNVILRQGENEEAMRMLEDIHAFYKELDARLKSHGPGIE